MEINRDILNARRHYAAAVVGTLLFAGVYELFSHRVYSGYMLFAFAFPLLGGVLLYTLLWRLPAALRPGPVSRCLYDSGLATLTAGSLFRGVMDIYGSSSRLNAVYWAAGLALIALGLVLYLLDLIQKRN